MQLIQKCAHCHQYGIKLWRQYACFLDLDDLLCTKCAEFEQNRKYDPTKEKYSIAWRVPFCPTPEGSAWGYTSVPREDVIKFDRLPI